MSSVNVGLWNTYAQTQTHHNSKTGHAFTPTAINVFNQLGAKFLQVNPTGSLPQTPPSAAFIGDSLNISATGGTAQVNFVSNAANGTNTKTEFLLQPLKSKNRTPQAKGYKSRGFTAFTAGGLTVTVIATAGWYVPVYRFVNTLTGQATALVVLQPVQVS